MSAIFNCKRGINLVGTNMKMWWGMLSWINYYSQVPNFFYQLLGRNKAAIRPYVATRTKQSG